MRYRMMMIVLLVVTLLAGCTLDRIQINSGRSVTITGSGSIVTREESFSEFDQLDVSHAFQVEIRQGDFFRVIIRTDDNLVEYLRVVQRGSTLEIGLKSNTNVRRATLEAEVTMPELIGLELSGASNATLVDWKSTQRLTVDLSGASSLRGEAEIGDVRLEVSGASNVSLTGSAQDLVVNASGASIVDLAEFPVEDADVEASGASMATVNVNGRLDVDASGASHVYYLGEPTLGNMESSGASSIGRR